MKNRMDRIVIARSASDEAIRCAPQHSDLGGLLRFARNDLRWNDMS